MTNRIRYEKTNVPEIFKSSRTYLCENTIEVRVIINSVTKAYAIVKTINDDILVHGVGSSFHDTKIKAKKALEGMGVAFAEEKRKPRKIDQI